MFAFGRNLLQQQRIEIIVDMESFSGLLETLPANFWCAYTATQNLKASLVSSAWSQSPAHPRTVELTENAKKQFSLKFDCFDTADINLKLNIYTY